MKVFVTRVTDLICGAVVETLCDRGHKLLGLLRFEVKAVVPEESRIKQIILTLAGSAGQPTLNRWLATVKERLT